MAAQAAGTGASAGAAVVSESDMSVVCVLSCPIAVFPMPMDPRERKAYRERANKSVPVEGGGTHGEVGGDKHVRRAAHVCTQRLEGG